MKACGIIVEYNPFHNGHAYHIEQAKAMSGADVVVAVMSGNFLQRGEPAILDKWARARQALQNGVDLVIELPVVWSVQAADYFARGGIKLLQSLNCDYLCFGTDAPTAVDYQSFGAFTAANQQLIERTYREINQPQMSHSRQMTQVYQQLYPELHVDLSSPNHILGLSYAKENALYERPMALLPIKRQASQYHEEHIQSEFASATAVRAAALKQQWEAVSYVVPKETLSHLRGGPLISWETYWPLLRYRIITSSPEQLRQIYQMTEGLEHRFKEKVIAAQTFYHFIEAVKSKRYSWTRLQRLALYVLLNVSASEVGYGWANSYLNVLGMTEAGQAYLKGQKTESQLPIFTKQSKASANFFATGVKCDRVYQLGDTRLTEQNSGRFPVRIKNA